jgi:WD40 repeat protein
MLIVPMTVTALSFTPDGVLLATASTLGFVRIWETTHWELMNELRDSKVQQTSTSLIVSGTTITSD